MRHFLWGRSEDIAIPLQSVLRAVYVPLAEEEVFFCVMNFDDLSLQDSVRSQEKNQTFFCGVNCLMTAVFAGLREEIRGAEDRFAKCSQRCVCV